MDKHPSAPQKIRGRIVRIRLADGTLINGQVNLKRGRGYDRLSDLVSDPATPFLILFNATVYEASSENPVRRNTLFVNKPHIVWVEPDEDQK